MCMVFLSYLTINCRELSENKSGIVHRLEVPEDKCKPIKDTKTILAEILISMMAISF